MAGGAAALRWGSPIGRDPNRRIGLGVDRVNVPGRLDVFPPGFIGAYSALISTGQGWDAAVETYGISIALVAYADDPLADRGLRAGVFNAKLGQLARARHHFLEGIECRRAADPAQPRPQAP